MEQQQAEIPTLGGLLMRAAEKWPDNEVLVFPDERLTYKQLLERVQVKARCLQGMGVRSGDHVGILQPNLVELVELVFAIALSGAVAVLINARYKSMELAYVIENADLKFLFTTDRFANYSDFTNLLYQALPGLGESEDPSAINLATAPMLEAVILVENSTKPGFIQLDQFMAYADQIDMDELSRRSREVALSWPCIMMYTSGTTSEPKGCRLSHAALVRNAGEMSKRFQITGQDRQWNPLPLFHLSGLLPLLSLVWKGGCFITDSHFNENDVMITLQAEVPTILFTAFPTIMSAVVNHPDFSADKIPQVRLINNVAPPEQLKKNMALIPQAVHVSAYGLTEASGVSCNGSIDEDDETRANTSGKPYDGVEVRIVDINTREKVKPEEPGEMTIRGYSLFEGYYKSPEKTAEVFDEQGWFYTGDLCTIDTEGRVSYRGRIKDMLKVGGENVAAIEIESFLCRHPSVQIAQVVGIPDEKLQEVVAAFIQTNPGMSCTEKEIQEYCQGKIASFKIPRIIRFVDHWPMSATKIQKFKLRESLCQELENPATEIN